MTQPADVAADRDHPDARAGQRRLPAPARLLAQLVAAVATGLLLGLAFPPYGLWWLAPLCVAASTLLVRDVGWRRALLLGLVLGMATYLLQLRWLLVIGWDAWVLLSFAEAVFLGLTLAGAALVQRLPGWPLWVACLWVAGEVARSTVPFGGFPWGRLAFAQADAPYKGYAALGGMPLLSFAVALSGTLLALAVLRFRNHRPPERRRVGAWVAVGAAVAVPLLALAVPLPTDGQQVTAAVVQGNVPRSGLDAFGQRAAVLTNHVETTKALAADVEAGRAPQPQLVIWPENSTDIDPYADATAKAAIQGAVDAINAPTLVGAVVTNPADTSTVLNLGIVWAPSSDPGGGGPGDAYAKRHPVPFGEYVPFRPLLTKFVQQLSLVPHDFAPGQRPGLLQLGPVTIGDVICFEVAYDSIVHDVAVGDPGLLVVQTNNATYGRTGQPDQQLAMSRLRAVQTGRTVLVAATSGLSAVVAPDGTVTAGSKEFERWTYDGPVTVRTGRTLATALGPWPGLILGTLGVGAVAVAVAVQGGVNGRRRREGSHRTDASQPEL